MLGRLEDPDIYNDLVDPRRADATWYRQRGFVHGDDKPGAGNETRRKAQELRAGLAEHYATQEEIAGSLGSVAWPARRAATGGTEQIIPRGATGMSEPFEPFVRTTSGFCKIIGATPECKLPATADVTVQLVRRVDLLCEHAWAAFL